MCFFSLKQFAELFSFVFWWSASRDLPLGGISKSKCSRKQKSKRLLPRLPPRLLLEAVWPIFWRLGFLSDPSPMFALPCHSVKNEVEFTQPLQKSRNLSWIMLNLIVISLCQTKINRGRWIRLNWIVVFCQSCYMDLEKLLHVFLALCQTKPSWSLIKILKLVDWLKALNKVWRLNASGPMCPWQCFYEIYKRNIYGTKEKLLDGPLPPPYKDDNIDPTSWQKTGKSRKFEKNLVVDWASAARRSRSRLKST